MIRFALALATTALVAVQPAPALIAAQPAPADAPLAPHSKWNVEYGDNQCTLIRTFGPNGDVTLALRPMTGGSLVKVAVFTDDRAKRLFSGKASLAVGGFEAKALDYYTMIDPKSAKRIVIVKADRTNLKNLGIASTLRVQAGDLPERAFALEHMKGALAALDACETDLAKQWGANPETIAQPAKPLNYGAWVNIDDYPEAALLGQDSGETSLRMAIDTRGRPSDCKIIADSGSKELDDQLCKVVMRRARFEPARDKGGAAVASVWSTSVFWMF